MKHLTFRYTKLTSLAILIAVGSNAVGSEDLTIEPKVVESKYCLEPKGVVSFRVTLSLSYHNASQVAILLPRITQLSRYLLYRDEEELKAKQASFWSRYQKVRMYDAAKLDPLTPDPEFFDTVLPGATFDQREHQVIVVVRPNLRPGLELLGTEPYLQVEIDHWPDRRVSGEKLRESWKPHGRLLIDKVVSLPVRLHIEKEPAAKPCRGPTEVRIKPEASARQGR